MLAWFGLTSRDSSYRNALWRWCGSPSYNPVNWIKQCINTYMCMALLDERTNLISMLTPIHLNIINICKHNYLLIHNVTKTMSRISQDIAKHCKLNTLIKIAVGSTKDYRLSIIIKVTTMAVYTRLTRSNTTTTWSTSCCLRQPFDIWSTHRQTVGICNVEI